MRKTTPEDALGHERYSKIMERAAAVKRKDGTKKPVEYRLVTYDPTFDNHGKYCEICKEMHISPRENPYVLPSVPKRIGLNWAAAHHIESVIEIRDGSIEVKKGKKTVPQGTWIDPKTLLVFSEWRPYMKISKMGKVEKV
jgi:hypothetical protein